MNRFRHLICLAALLGLHPLTVTPTAAQVRVEVWRPGWPPVRRPLPPPRRPILNRADARLLSEVSRDGAALADLARLGVRQSRTGKVRHAAERLATDQVAITRELDRLAYRFDLPTPASRAADRHDLDPLRDRDNRHFDGAWIDLTRHRLDEQAHRLRWSLREAYDPEVRDFVRWALPQVEQQQRDLHQLADWQRRRSGHRKTNRHRHGDRWCHEDHGGPRFDLDDESDD